MTPVTKEASVKTNKNGISFAPTPLIKVEQGWNPRKRAQADDPLITSVTQHQVINPLHVRLKNKKDVFYLIDGERRLDAAIKAGLGSVPVINHGVMSDKDALIIALQADEHQKKLTKKEKIGVFKRLRREGLTVEETAKVMGVDKRLVDEMAKVEENGSPALKKEVSKGPKKGGINSRVASRAAGLPKKVQEKIIPKLKGKSREEGIKTVQNEEKKIGIKRPGKQPEPRKIVASTGKYTIAPDAADRCQQMEKAIRAKLALVGGQNRVLNSQLLVLQCIKGQMAPQDLFGWDNV